MSSTKTKPRKSAKPITTAEFDAKFDRGEDISEHLDFSQARMFAPGEDETLDLKPQKVNVDFPSWVVSGLDRESDRLGIPRQSLIKVWIAERSNRKAPSTSSPQQPHEASQGPPSAAESGDPHQAQEVRHAGFCGSNEEGLSKRKDAPGRDHTGDH